MKNALIVPVAAALIVGAGAGFFGGMKFQQSQPGQFRGMMGTQGARTNRGGQPFGQGGAGGMNGAFGEIISKSDTSVTLKLRDGGSRILFFSATVPVTKSVPGAVTDLVVGANVSARGTTNADGSVTAQSIQIVPAAPAPATK